MSLRTHFILKLKKENVEIIVCCIYISPSNCRIRVYPRWKISNKYLEVTAPTTSVKPAPIWRTPSNVKQILIVQHHASNVFTGRCFGCCLSILPLQRILYSCSAVGNHWTHCNKIQLGVVPLAI